MKTQIEKIASRLRDIMQEVEDLRDETTEEQGGNLDNAIASLSDAEFNLLKIIEP